MSDVFSPTQRAAVMRAVKSRDTSPERKVRAVLSQVRRGYRLHARELPGSPDIVFRRTRHAMFVHGCFWHGHSCARGARLPKTNGDYWRSKIARNRARDTSALELLHASGWRTLTIWECDIRDTVALRARLEAFLRQT